ncbi:MAG: hypothetical protein ACE5FC_01905 [Myxococcota bacterium]
MRRTEPAARALFLFTDHLELTRDPAFSDNILHLLLEDPRSEAGE